MTLICLLALVFAAAALLIKDEQGRRDTVLIITAFFLWGLFSALGLMILEYSYHVPIWPPFRHLSLMAVEFPMYALVVILLKDSILSVIRAGIKKLLNE